jgi:hypothetical protein
MWRWLAIAALGAALLITPVWGQRGGRGGMAAGGHGGFSSHAGGGFSRGPGFGGTPHARAGWGGSNGWVRARPGNGGWGRRRPYGGYPYWRYGYPWGYGFGWSWYPGWGWYGDTGFYDDSYSYPAQSYPAYAYPSNSDSYAQNDQVQQEEIDRLNQEVARLRDEGESREAPTTTTQVHGETVLLFRDGHTEEIQNYAIVGKTLWVFTEQRARKIPIAELNVQATTKANEDRGIDFRLPK